MLSKACGRWIRLAACGQGTKVRDVGEGVRARGKGECVMERDEVTDEDVVGKGCGHFCR